MLIFWIILLFLCRLLKLAISLRGVGDGITDTEFGFWDTSRMACVHRMRNEKGNSKQIPNI